MLIVQKYGGSSLATPQLVMNVASGIGKYYERGEDVVVVLSAQGDTTNELLEKANELSNNASKRELDMLLCTGEQQSAALMAIALHTLGYPAISLNAGQAGIWSTPNHGDAKIVSIDEGRIQRELENKNIVIITGFQGLSDNGDITTLGRGASDTTAVALASALNADKCEIITDVGGVYTADPRIIKNAKKHDEISFDEMLELSSMGAKVLHNRSVELAKKYNIDITVKSSSKSMSGTVITRKPAEFGGLGIEKKSVSGITADRNVCKISVTGRNSEKDKIYEILTALVEHGIKTDMMVQSINGDDTQIDFSVSEDNADLAAKILKLTEAGEVKVFKNLSKLSVIGIGIANDPAILAQIYDTLHKEGIGVYLISAYELKISALCDRDMINRAVSAVHENLFGGFKF